MPTVVEPSAGPPTGSSVGATAWPHHRAAPSRSRDPRRPHCRRTTHCRRGGSTESRRHRRPPHPTTGSHAGRLDIRDRISPNHRSAASTRADRRSGQPDRLSHRTDAGTTAPLPKPLMQHAFRRAGRAPKILHTEHLRQSNAGSAPLPAPPLTGVAGSSGTADKHPSQTVTSDQSTVEALPDKNIGMYCTAKYRYWTN